MGYLGYKPADKPLTSADITDGIIVNADIANATIALAKLSATGTPSAATFLRGDNSWGEAGAAAGQVIQVLSATDSTQRSTTSTSFVTASNTLTVTITPSSSSNKILIISTFSIYSNAETPYYTIYRGATNLGNGNSGMNLGNATGYMSSAVSYLDSPSTTSATTYQIYFRNNGGGTSYLNVDNPKGSITCMEIKG